MDEDAAGASCDAAATATGTGAATTGGAASAEDAVLLLAMSLVEATGTPALRWARRSAESTVPTVFMTTGASPVGARSGRTHTTAPVALFEKYTVFPCALATQYLQVWVGGGSPDTAGGSIDDGAYASWWRSGKWP